MVEYLYDAIRASAGDEVSLGAVISDATGEEDCLLYLYNDAKEEFFCSEGLFDVENGYWGFTIPSSITQTLSGRYWYCICDRGTTLQFKQPIYFV